MTQSGQPIFAGTERFEILSRLGSGGMGVVYAAFDRERQTKVALKTVKQPTPESLLRLKREFRALQDLTHPNLVSLGELHEEAGQWFFTMELLEGIDFIRWVTRGGPADQRGDELAATIVHRPGGAPGGAPPRGALPVTTPAADELPPSATQPEPAGSTVVVDADSDAPTDHGPRIRALPFDELRLRDGLRQLAEGLTALHRARRVHRDIKPSNILVTPEGRLVLLDFGLVSELYGLDEETGGHVPMGTAAYMAPEQAAGQRVGPEADWYGVGVVLFRALTKELPFMGTQERILQRKQQEAAPRVRERVAAVPPDLDDLCAGLLEFDPSRRPTGPEVLARLAAAQDAASTALADPTLGGTPDATSLSPTRVFVGREGELQALRDALGQVAQGHAAAVLLHGASGLGKSEIIQAFVREQRLEDPAPLILTGRCYEQETVPFKAFDGVVDTLSRLLLQLPKEESYRVTPRDAALLVRMFPVLGRVEALASAPRPRRQIQDLQERRARTFAALRELLSCLADQVPLVLVIDDLHWADADSLLLLKALLQPPDVPVLLLVAALRTPQGDPDADADADHAAMRSHRLGIAEVRAVFPEPPTELPIAALPPAEARTLAARLIRSYEGAYIPDTEGLAERISHEAGGHPLFIQELVRHTVRRGPAQVQETRLEDALWGRLVDLEPELRELLELLSVAGGPIRQDRLAEAADLDPSAATRILSRLRIAHLVRTRGPRLRDRVEVYHDRIRQAVLSRLASGRRLHCYDRLAGALLAAPDGEPEQLATFLEGAGKPVLAARYLAEAAGHAANALAFDRAARLYERALVLQEAPDSSEEREERRQLWIQLADARANAGRGAQAAEAYHAAEEGAPAAEVLDLKRRAAEQLLRSGHVDDGLRVTRQVLEALHLRWPRSPTGALASLVWRRLRLRLRGMRFRERDASLVGAEHLLRVDICFALSTGLAVADHIRGADFSSRFVGYALDSGEPGRVLRALCIEANFAAAQYNQRYLARVLRAAEELLERHDDPSTHGYLDGARGFAAFMGGKWGEALEHAEAAERHLLEYGGMSWERATARFVILWALFYLGRWRQLGERARPLVDEALDRGDRYAAVGMFLGLNNVAWLTSDGAEATRARVRDMLARWDVQGYHLQHYYGMLAEAQIDLHEGAGRQAHARITEHWTPLKRSMLLKIPSVRHEALHLRGRCAAAAALEAKGSERAALHREACRAAARLSRRRLAWPRALAPLVRAAVEAQQGRTDFAVSSLEQAVEELERQEMRLYAAAACHRLGGLVGGDHGAELRREAEAVLGEQGFPEPAPIIALLASGFPEA